MKILKLGYFWFQIIYHISLKNFIEIRFNKISVLPRGFGAFPTLEVLDLTYNNISEKSLPNNFFELSMVNLID